MKISASLRWLVVLILFMALIAVLATRADASGGGHDDGGDVTVNGGDVNVGGATVTTGVDLQTSTDFVGSTNKSTSYALAPPGLGDVDIAQCLGSEAWTLLVGGKQKLVLNQVCMAEFYLKQGRFDLAAQALCNQPEILEEYGTETDCEDAHDFTPPEPLGEGSSGVADQIVGHIDDAVEQHDEDLQMVQSQLAQVTERLETYEQRPAPRPRVVQQAEPEPLMSEQEKLDILALLYGDEDDE